MGWWCGGNGSGGGLIGKHTRRNEGVMVLMLPSVEFVTWSSIPIG